ncbi:MAG: hypothetical protein WKF76_05545 [Nocardioidaceae bacterium]
MSRARLLQLVDLVVVLALAVTALTQVWTLPKEELQGGRAVHMVLVMAFTLPLLLRRRYAVAGFVTVVAAAWLQFELGGGSASRSSPSGWRSTRSGRTPRCR